MAQSSVDLALTKRKCGSIRKANDFMQQSCLSSKSADCTDFFFLLLLLVYYLHTMFE